MFIQIINYYFYFQGNVENVFNLKNKSHNYNNPLSKYLKVDINIEFPQPIRN